MNEQEDPNEMISPERRSIRDIPLRNKYVDVSEEKADLKTDHIPTHPVEASEVEHIEAIAHEKPADRPRKPKAVPTKSIDGQLHHTHTEYEGEPALFEGDKSIIENDLESDHIGSADLVEGNRKSRWGWWILGGLIILALLYFVLHTFAHAKIAIVRSAEVVSLEGESFALGSDLSYKSMTFDISASTTVNASGVSNIAEKAKGQVIIYNSSRTDQKLVAGTRIEAASGRIYRLTANVTVPKLASVNKKEIPGSITASVVADAGGEAYNSPLTNFTFPGFKGTAKFNTIYGKSKTTMTGGGTVISTNASDTDVAAAKGLLQVQLKDDAEAKGLALSNDTYVYIPGSLILKSDKVVQSYDAKNKSAVISQHGQATLVIIEKTSIAKVLAAKSGMFNASSTITVSPIVQSWDLTSIPLKSNTATSIVLSGSSTIAVTLDPDQVASAVSHLKRDEALLVIQHIPGVEAVEISVTPWWESVLPGSGSISVDIE